MAIRKNSDGKTATVKQTGVYGNVADGGGTPRRSNPMAMESASVAKRLPKQTKPVPKRSR